MDAAQVGVQVLGIVAVAAATFYAVSFAELREKSLKDLEDDDNGGGHKLYESSRRERRARRRKAEKAEKQSKP